ncbi:unnamed protein product [Closterium sp. NIES-54]
MSEVSINPASINSLHFSLQISASPGVIHRFLWNTGSSVINFSSISLTVHFPNSCKVKAKAWRNLASTACSAFLPSGLIASPTSHSASFAPAGMHAHAPIFSATSLASSCLWVLSQTSPLHILRVSHSITCPSIALPSALRLSCSVTPSARVMSSPYPIASSRSSAVGSSHCFFQWSYTIPSPALPFSILNPAAPSKVTRVGHALRSSPTLLHGHCVSCLPFFTGAAILPTSSISFTVLPHDRFTPSSSSCSCNGEAVSPASRPASPVRAARASGRGSRQRPPPVLGTHRMSLRPSTAPLRAPLPSPSASSLPALVDLESDSLRAASPTVMRLLATVVTDPSFESTAASALVVELVDFAARCRLDYAASLDAESASVCPPSVGGECALGTDVLEDRQEEFQGLAAASPDLASVLLTPRGDSDALDIPTPRSYAEAVEGPYSSQWQAAMDAEMASWKSTGTYVDAVPPPGANIVSGMWIFRLKRPPGSPPVFKARYVARGFSQRQGVDYFQTFSPTPKMTTLRVLLHIAAQRDYELYSLDFSTAFLQALGFAPSSADPLLFLRSDTSLAPFYILVYVHDLVFATGDTSGLAHVKSELQKRYTCTDLGELRSYLGLQITRDRARRTITLTQSHMVQQVLQRFGFTYSSPQATPLSSRHSLLALPSDESVVSECYLIAFGCLMYLMTCTRPDLAYPLSVLARYVAPGRHRLEHLWVLRYLCSTSGMGLVLGGRSPVVLTGHADASWADDQATQRSSQGYTFSLNSGSVSWRATRSSSFLGSSCEAEIYAGAMAAQELRWLTYLLTDLGELPRSPLVLCVDNKAMLALCQEQRLEHRTKHIALRYFLARELQQRGQLRLAYVASEANTADVFTKALPPCDHQRFCTQLGLVPVLPHLLTS